MSNKKDQVQITLPQPEDGIGVDFYFESLQDGNYKKTFRTCESLCVDGHKDMIDGILRVSNWTEESVYDKVNYHFTNYKLNRAELKKLFKARKDGTIPGLSEHIKSGKPFNLIEALRPIIEPITPNFESLVYDLYKTNEKQNNTSIGPAEILLSIFTPSTKGRTGDLFYDDLGGVEIKSSQGRLGKSKYTNTIVTERKLEKILNKHGKSVYPILIKEQMDRFEKWDADLNIRRFEKYLKKDEIYGMFAHRALELFKHLKEEKEGIQCIDFYKRNDPWHHDDFILPLKEAMDILDELHDSIKGKPSFKVPKVCIGSIKDLFNILDPIRVIITNPEKHKTSWVQFVDTFLLNDFDIPLEDYITGFLETRTEKLTDELYADLKSVAYKLFEGRKDRYIKENNRQGIRRCILALQICTYSLAEGFNYLLLCNRYNLDCIAINTTYENPKRLFSRILWQLWQDSRIMPDVYSVEDRNAGVGISFCTHK